MSYYSLRSNHETILPSKLDVTNGNVHKYIDNNLEALKFVSNVHNDRLRRVRRRVEEVANYTQVGDAIFGEGGDDYLSENALAISGDGTTIAVVSILFKLNMKNYIDNLSCTTLKRHRVIRCISKSFAGIIWLGMKLANFQTIRLKIWLLVLAGIRYL